MCCLSQMTSSEDGKDSVDFVEADAATWIRSKEVTLTQPLRVSARILFKSSLSISVNSILRTTCLAQHRFF
jgi:hypothetical protein